MNSFLIFAIGMFAGAAVMGALWWLCRNLPEDDDPTFGGGGR